MDKSTLEECLILKEKPVKITGGGNHTLLLTESGSLYIAGEINGKRFEKFELIDARYGKIMDMTSGWDFGVMVNEYNELYVFGIGLNGELGLSEKVTSCDVLNPKFVIKFDHKIKKINSSLHNTVLILENGEVYGWGNNKKQQLLQHDLTKSNKIIWEPTRLFVTFSNLRFANCRDFIVYQFVNPETNETNKFELRGKDNFNILNGLNSKEHIIDMKPMWSSVHLLIVETETQSKKIRSLGNNSNCQLFPTSSNLDIKDYAIGSEHGLTLTADNKVLAWGWGEHGNCGTTQNENNVILNQLYNGIETVKGIYSGCSTSWVIVQI
ncbi:hypothetical protein PACTADRAFT_48129, partial [Pachysolen tannophilus NRRL Y-2460]